jgi:hypothetical protein
MRQPRTITLQVDTNADDQPVMWLLYYPEENQYKDPNVYLWLRRCSVHTSVQSIYKYLERLGINTSGLGERHELFPELFVFTDVRSNRKWYFERAPIHG